MSINLATNATVQVQHRVYNPTTKQSRLDAVGPAFPCYLRDITLNLREQGVATEFTLKMTCDGLIDIRDGDLVLGYTGPLPNRPGNLTVDHVEHRFLPDSTDSFKVAHILVKQ